MPSQRTLGPGGKFSPKKLKGLALWLDASSAPTLLPLSNAVLPSGYSPEVACASTPMLWVAADNPQNIVSNGRVVQLNDMGIFGAHMSATGYGHAWTSPTLVAGAIGGQPVMRFNGSTDALYTGFLAYNTARTMVAVVQVNEPKSSPQAIITVGDTTESYTYLNVAASSSVLLGAMTHSLQTARAAAPKPVIVVVTYDVVTKITNVYFNGRLSATITEAPSEVRYEAVEFFLGNRPNNDHPAACDLAEAIVYDQTFSAAEVNQLTLWLSQKYSIVTDVSPASMVNNAVTSPQELSGCVGWWDCSRTDKMFNATTGGSLVANGGAVLRLEDLSGNGKHLVQATSASAPSRQDGAKNGLPALNFAGTKSLAAGVAGDWNFLHNTQGGTVIAVIKPFDTADPNTFAYGVATNVGGASNQIGWSLFFDDRVLYPRNNHVSHSVMAGVSQQTVVSQEQNNAIPSANDFSLLSFTPFAGSSTTAGRGRMYVSGTATGNTNSSTLAPTASNSTNALTVGSSFGANSIAGLAELIVYNTVLSAVDRARVEKYLQQKWATPTVPDSTPLVGAWLDRSGNNRHAVQATAGNRPAISATNQGGRKVLAFDAGTKTIVSPATVAQYVADATTSPKMFFAFVARPEGGTSAITYGTPTNPDSASRVFYNSDFGIAGNHIVDF
jgi:hypothetical protein